MRFPFGWLRGRGPHTPAPRPQQPPPRAARRNYQAGMLDRLTADWTSTPLTADYTALAYARRLRARSRQQVENNPYARKFISLLRSNIVGPSGIGLQPVTRDPDGTLDQAANRAIADAWADWGTSRACDASGRHTWLELQHLVLSSAAVDGEAFVQIYRSPDFGPYGFALALIDPERIDLDYNEDLRNGNAIRLGIEHDEYRRPVAYYINSGKERADGSLPTYGATRTRVPADQIIHFLLAERPNQTRGLPWMATALYRLKMIGSYEDAALIAARIGASKMGFIYSDTGEAFAGDDQDTDGSPIEEIEPAVIRQLPNGSKFQEYSPEYPRGDLAPFNAAMLRGISAGLGPAYPVLSQDWSNTNYNTIKASLGDERDTWRTLQTLFSSGFHARAYNAWIQTQLLTGTIAISGIPLNTSREAKYRRVNWRGRRWDGVDPLKETNAALAAIDAGLMSRFSWIRDHSQEDPEEVIAEIARERDIYAALGIPLAPTPAGAPTPPADDPED